MRDVESIGDAYDDRRAELYSAARTQAITTVTQIERRLQSQVATVHKLSLQQYGRSSQDNQGSSMGRDQCMSAEVCLDGRSSFDRRNEPKGLAEGGPSSPLRSICSKTFVINQGDVHHS